MASDRTRTSTPTIMVFGKEVPNPAYSAVQEDQTRLRLEAQYVSTLGDMPTELPPVTEDRVTPEAMVDFFEYDDSLDPVELRDMVKSVDTTTPDGREMIAQMHALSGRSSTGRSPQQQVDDISYALDRTHVIARSMDESDLGYANYVEEYGERATDDFEEFTVGDSKYYAI